MGTIRWRLRWLLLGLMVAGVLWLHLSNYVLIGSTPLDMLREKPAAALIIWMGALALGLVLDALAGWHLRPFFRALAQLKATGSLPPDRAEVAAALAIRWPEQASLWLLGLAMVLSLVFHAVEMPETLLQQWRDPVMRGEVLQNFLREMVLTLILALLLFTFSRRLLQRAVAAFALRQVPAGRPVPVGLRFAAVVVAQAAMYTSVFVSSADVPPGRLLWLYLPLGLVGTLVGYLVATDTGRDLSAIATRLRALAAGVRPDLFHRLAVTGRDEVAGLVAAINGLQDRVEGEFRAIERDLQAARSIQTEMLPRAWSVPPGWQVSARQVPAQEVGGDFYDIIPLGGRRFGVAVGDAAGKGLPAALLMASTVSLLRSHAPLHAGPGAVLAAMNRLLCSSLPPMTFVTVAYAVVDVEQRLVTWSSAGHLPPVIGGREAEPRGSLPLGVDPEVQYGECTCALPPGTPFLLFSDGLVEAHDPAGRLLGTAAVEALAGRAGIGADRLLTDLFAAVSRHGGGQPPADDVTALVLVPPAELQLELPSCYGSELLAAEATGDFARTYGPPGRADDVATAVGEACLNACVHGNGLQAGQLVQVRLVAGPDWLEATVADLGEMFVPPDRPPQIRDQMEGDGPIHGWGLHLMRATADAVVVEPLVRGKQVRLRFFAGGRERV